jgi:hypothetical protein
MKIYLIVKGMRMEGYEVVKVFVNEKSAEDYFNAYAEENDFNITDPDSPFLKWCYNDYLELIKLETEEKP